MTIIVVPTERCQFRCSGCFEPDKVHEGVGVKYDYNAMANSLKQVWGGPYHGSDVCLHGGEALLMPVSELKKLMKLIYELPWDNNGAQKGVVSIVTNGALITDKHIELFKRYNVHVAISCDGPPKLNIYRGPNPSDKDVTLQYNYELVKTIKKLRSENIPVSIMCILHSGNVSNKEKRAKLGGWILWLKSIGITSGRMNPMYSNDHPELEPTNKDVFQTWVNLYHLNKKHGLRWNPLIEIEKNLKREKGERGNFFPQPCTFNRCNPFNTHTLSILPDGTIGNCDRTFARGLSPRSIDGKNSGRYEALEQLDCASCNYWEICGGGCPEEGVGGDWRHKTRFCEAIKKIYDYVAKKNNIIFTSMKTETRVIGNSPHGDSAHGDSGHGDSLHGDSPHGDIPHGDSSHGDSPDYK